MPATEVTHKFFDVAPLWVGKVGAAGVESAIASVIPASSVPGLTNGNAYIFTINRVNSTGTTKYPANERETAIGKLNGVNFTECVRAVEGVAQAWEADTVIEILFTAEIWSKLIEGIEVEHNADGTHKNISSNAAGITGKTTPSGALVGTTDTQTLANKTLTAPAITTPTIDVISGTEMKTNLNTKKVVDDGATITLDLALASIFEFTMAGNRALAVSNIPTVTATKFKPLIIRPIQDATGSRTLTWFNTLSVTITVTIATPGVVTLGKDIPTCTPIKFTTTGALPTGITASTVYYWIRNDATTGWLATSKANAQAGTKVATSGSQSGVHTGNIQIRWAGGAEPTLTTGKYAVDEIGLKIIDSANGVWEGCVVSQDT